MLFNPFTPLDSVLPSSTAIVSDSLGMASGAGGAERMVSTLHDLFPQAPIYTTVYNLERMPACNRTWDIRPSFVQRLPFAKTRHNTYLALMPMAVEAFDLSSYDLVISANFAVAKGAVAHPDALHICYCHSLIGHAWDGYHAYRGHERISFLEKIALPLLMHYLKLWDAVAAQRVDRFACVSHCVARHITKCYRRRATVIHPPVNTRFFVPQNLERDRFYLLVSRLISHKRLDVAIKAFNALRLPLWIVGDGNQRPVLERMARSNIHFVGRVSDAVLKECYARCRALVLPSEDDCGTVPLEAQAMGTPVIACAAGGATETVVDGVTGCFFYPQTSDALADAAAFDPDRYDRERIREHACEFDIAAFRDKFISFAAREYRLHRQRLLSRQEGSRELASRSATTKGP